MKCRMLMAVYLLLTALAVCAVTAQGVVVESVDDDIVEEVPAKDSPVDKDTAAADTNIAADKDTVTIDKKAADSKGLDLDALLVGDEEDDLLIDDLPVVKQAAGVDSADADPLSVKAGDETAVKADSSLQRGRGRRSGAPAASAQADKSASDSADTGPAVIEDGKTINFAHNLKEYRSPRIAMLLSLLVPGLGQVYSRSYGKAAAFGAAELAVIGAAAYFNSVGKSKKEKAHRWADERFSIEKLQEYNTRLQDEFTALKDEIGHKDSLSFSPPFVYYDADFFSAADKKQPFFYESIRDGLFTPGWLDNELPLSEILKLSGGEKDTLYAASGRYVLSDSLSLSFFYLITRVVDAAGIITEVGPMLGYSSNQAEYNSRIKDANAYRDAVNYAIYALLVNHIASAVDAGFTARAYNARLLGQESVWDRVSVEQQYVFTGSEVSPGLALKVRF